MQMPREPAPVAFAAEQTSIEQPVRGTINPPARSDSFKHAIFSHPKHEFEPQSKRLLTDLNSARFNP